ncbi:MAG TPA: ankyrin repeat domain-containing protein [Nitrospirales bacterium]|nr:ankyrin repeat domain-containing protein [Nitrospirales bacterium]
MWTSWILSPRPNGQMAVLVLPAHSNRGIVGRGYMSDPRFLLRIVVLIVSVGAVACTEKEQLPPLHMAAQSGILIEVKQLIIGGHGVNQRDETYGFTPLHQAVFFGHREIVEFLIAEGADVNAKNIAGSTPLYLAKGKRHNAIGDLLERHGAIE